MTCAPYKSATLPFFLMDVTSLWVEQLRRGEMIQIVLDVKFLDGRLKKGKGSAILTNLTVSFVDSKGKYKFCYSWFDLKGIDLTAEKCSISFQKDMFEFSFEPRQPMLQSVFQDTIASQFLLSEIRNLTLKGIEVPQDESRLNPMARIASQCRANNHELEPSFWNMICELGAFHKESVDLTCFQQSQEVEDLFLENLHLFPFVRSLKVTNRNGCSRAVCRYLKKKVPLSHIELVGPVGKTFREFLDIVEQTNIRCLGFYQAEFSKEQLDVLNQKLVHLDLEELGLHNAIREDCIKYFYQSFLNSQLVDHVCTLNLAGTTPLDLETLFAKVKTVSSLCLADCDLEIADALLFARKSGLSEIRMLDLSGNLATKPISVAALLPKTLQCLKVNNVKWGKGTLGSLLNVAFSRKKMRKVKLCISHAKVRTREWCDLFRAVEFLSGQRLSGLEWDGNPVDRRLFEFLKRQDIRELSMSACMHGTFIDPAYGLADLVRTSKTLRVLTFNNTENICLGPATAIVLEACLGHPSLEELSFTDSKADTACLASLWTLVNLPSSIRKISCDGMGPITDVGSYLRVIQDIATSVNPVCFRCPFRDLTALLNARLISQAQFNDLTGQFFRKTFQLSQPSIISVPDDGDLGTYASLMSINTISLGHVKIPQIPVVLDDADPPPLDFSMVPPRPVIKPWRKSASISESHVQTDIVSKLKYKWDLSEELLFPPLPISSFDPATWATMEAQFSLQNLYKLLRETQDLTQ